MAPIMSNFAYPSNCYNQVEDENIAVQNAYNIWGQRSLQILTNDMVGA